MAWIQSHQTLSDHPKTRKLTRLLSTSKAATIGHLHCLWWWAFDYAEDGSLDRFDAMDIAVAAEWDGDPDVLVDALVSAGFLDRDEAGTHIHDWDQYGGKLHAKRESDAERMRRRRAQDKDEQSDPVRRTFAERSPNVPSTSQVDKKRREKKREEESGNGADAPPKAKRATQVPGDFAVSDALAKWGKDNGFTTAQMTAQVPQFIDHWQAKGEARKDWSASFRTWMRNAREWNRLTPAPDGSLRVLTDWQGGGYDPIQRLPQDVLDDVNRQVAEARERELAAERERLAS